MLVIRMQRTGRKGHAMFRVVVQDSRRTPSSGKVVAQLGSYDPHAKSVVLSKDKVKFYLEHGAQPSDRAARLIASEGIDLPSWVVTPVSKSRTVRNPDKRRSTTPAPELSPEPEVAPPSEPEPATEDEPQEPTKDETAVSVDETSKSPK